MQLVLKLKNGTKEELTMAEAKELYDELHQIFGAKPQPFTMPEPLKGPPLTWPSVGDRTGPPWPFSPPDVYGPITCDTAKGKISWPM